MDIHRILTELRSEKERLEEAILTIERLAVGSVRKRRGRPPKWMASAKAATRMATRTASLMSEPFRLEHGDAEIDKHGDRDGQQDSLHCIHPP